MTAKTLAQLPKTHRCRLCRRKKPIKEMIVIRRWHTRDFLLRPRCKECHNARERGHRREYKTKYLRLWRKRNPELNESYWRSKQAEMRPINAIRSALRLANPLYHAAALIQGRLRRRLGMKVSIAEAKQLCREYGPCYPSRFGLTSGGLRECERIRSRCRRDGKPMKPIEIRMIVYADGHYKKPSRQQLPYRKSAQKLSDWWKRKKEETAA